MLSLEGGSAFSIDGEIENNVHVLVNSNGFISHVGRFKKPPKSSKRINCSGTFISPGFIEAHCHIGVCREGYGPQMDQANESTGPITPNMRAIDACDINDMHFSKALFDGGVTMANISPGSANIVGGTTDIISVFPASSIDELIIRPMVALKMAFGENPRRVYGSQRKSPATAMAVAALLRDHLVAAQNYIERRKDALKSKKHFDRNLSLEVTSELLSRKITAHCHSHRNIDIMTAIRTAEEFSYKLVLVHGTESAGLVDVLKRKKVPVILGPQGGVNKKLENRNRSLDLAAVLADNGVLFSISTDHPVIPLRDIRVEAAKMVNHGLDPAAAIRALTINPARILGIEKSVGSLSKGKRADIIVWDGHPLDVANSRVRHAIVGGREFKRPIKASDDFFENRKHC